MKELTREQCSQIAGGDPGMVLAGGWGDFGGGGSSFGSGGIDFGGGSVGIGFDSNASSGFGSSVGSVFESVWEGSGGFEPAAGAGAWSLAAIGIEGGPMAVVTIGGMPWGVQTFVNEPPIELYAPGEAPWEGQYLGQWVGAAPLSYEHTAVDGALIANTGRLAGTAAAALIEGALTGAEIGVATANPVGILGGLVIGTAVAAATYYLFQNDHETGAFVAIP
jgi:hypothetical protein